jgi:hypothetical protein
VSRRLSYESHSRRKALEKRRALVSYVVKMMSDGIRASEAPARAGAKPLASLSASGPTGFARAAWAHWKKIAHAVGVVQTRVLMVIFYFIVVLPIGLIMRLRGDPLHLKAPTDSNWTPHRHEEPSLDSARRQF